MSLGEFVACAFQSAGVKWTRAPALMMVLVSAVNRILDSLTCESSVDVLSQEACASGIAGSSLEMLNLFPFVGQVSGA